MADRGEEARFRLVGGFGVGLGFGQCLVQLRQLMGAFGNPSFEAFVGVLEGALGFAELGDVGETHDETTTGHGVADQLDHPAVGEYPFIAVCRALAHPVQTLGDVLLQVAAAEHAAFGIEADDLGNRPTDVDQALGVLEQLQITVVPGHQAQVLVNHADALGDVLDRTLQQGAVELQHLAGFVDDAHHILDLHLTAFDGGLDHRAGRGGAQHTGEQTFGVGDPLAIGRLVGIEVLAFALAQGEAVEALACAFFADETAGQHQQVGHLHCQQAAVAGFGAQVMADEAPGLPMLGNAGTREPGNPGEQQQVAGQ